MASTIASNFSSTNAPAAKEADPSSGHPRGGRHAEKSLGKENTSASLLSRRRRRRRGAQRTRFFGKPWHQQTQWISYVRERLVYYGRDRRFRLRIEGSYGNVVKTEQGRDPYIMPPEDQGPHLFKGPLLPAGVTREDAEASVDLAEKLVHLSRRFQALNIPETLVGEGHPLKNVFSGKGWAFSGALPAMRRRTFPKEEGRRGKVILEDRGRRIGPLETWIIAHVSHEAGHIRHSWIEEKMFADTGKTHQSITNVLEDERIEGLMERRFSELGPIYEATGDARLRSGFFRAFKNKTRVQALINFALSWRWLHDHPASKKATSSAPGISSLKQAGFLDDANGRPILDPGKLESKALPIIEGAWGAPDTKSVAEAALELMDAFGIDRQDQEGNKRSLPFGMGSAGNDTSALQGGPSISIAKGMDGRGRGGEKENGQDSSADNKENEGAEGKQAGPEAPEIDPASPNVRRAEKLAEGTRRARKELARALSGREGDPMPKAHRSKGHFDYGRYAQARMNPARTPYDPDVRLYRHRDEEEVPPKRVRVIADVSGSMNREGGGGTSRIWQMKRALILIIGAARKAGAPVDVVLFADRVYAAFSVDAKSTSTKGTSAKSTSVSYDEAALIAASAKAGGNTWLWRGLARMKQIAEEQEKAGGSVRGQATRTLLISDGNLCDQDPEECRKVLSGRGVKHMFAPLLPRWMGNAYTKQYDTLFGGKAQKLEEASELAKVAARWFRR